MGTTVKIVLDERRAKKDGTFPIYLRLIHNLEIRNIPLNYSANHRDWNEKEKQVKNSYPNSVRVNFIFNKKLTAAKKVLAENDSILHKLTVEEIKALILNFNPDEETDSRNGKGVSFFT